MSSFWGVAVPNADQHRSPRVADQPVNEFSEGMNKQQLGERLRVPSPRAPRSPSVF